MNGLIHQTKVKRYLIEKAAERRPSENFRRVSAETLAAAENALRQWLDSHLHRAPSRRTL